MYYIDALPPQLPIMGWPDVPVGPVVTVQGPGLHGTQAPAHGVPVGPQHLPHSQPSTAPPPAGQPGFHQAAWLTPVPKRQPSPPPRPPPPPPPPPPPGQAARVGVPGVPAPAQASSPTSSAMSSATSSSPGRQETWQADWRWRAEAAEDEAAALQLQRNLSAARVVVNRRLAQGQDRQRWHENLERIKSYLPHQFSGWTQLLNVLGVLPSAFLTSVAYDLDIRVQCFDEDFPFSYQRLLWPRGAAEALAPGLAGVPGVDGIPPIEVAAWSNNAGQAIGPAPTLFNAAVVPPPGQIFFMQGLRQYFWVFPVLNGQVLQPRKLPGRIVDADERVPGVPCFEPIKRWAPTDYEVLVEKARVTTWQGKTYFYDHEPTVLLYVEVPSVGRVPIGLVLQNSRSSHIHLWHCSLVTREIVERSELPHDQWVKKRGW